MGYLTHEGFGYFHESSAAHDSFTLLRVAGQWLMRNGYTLTGHGPGWLTAARGGVGLGFQGLEVPHRLSLRSDGQRARFEFSSQAAYPWQMGFFGPFTFAINGILYAHDQARIQESLFGPASAPAPPQSVRVVERQVVVARCKFCRGHTPIDAPSCANCGAAGFA